MVYIGIKGTVIALDSASGQEIWRTPLKGDFVNVALLESDLFASTAGELFCLDPQTGTIRWQNELKGLGRGLITIATDGGQQSVVMQRKHDDDDAANAAATATG